MTHWTDAADLIGERDEGGAGFCRPLCAGRARFRAQRGARGLSRLFPAVPARSAAARPLGRRTDLAFRRACAAPKLRAQDRRSPSADLRRSFRRPRSPSPPIPPPIPSARWCCRASARLRGLRSRRRQVPLPPSPPADLRARRRGGRAAAAAPAERARPTDEPATPDSTPATDGETPSVARLEAEARGDVRACSRNCSAGRDARPPRRRSTTLAYAAPPPVSAGVAPRSPGVATWAAAGGVGNFLRGLIVQHEPDLAFRRPCRRLRHLRPHRSICPTARGSRRIPASGRRATIPRKVNERMRGPTPPATYALSPREDSVPRRRRPAADPDRQQRLSAAPACSPIPTCWGRTATSNGCVSFRDYDAFLRAFRSGEITKLVVVSRL